MILLFKSKILALFNRVKNIIKKEHRDEPFKVLSEILQKYNVNLIIKDELGILSSRRPSDNFKYIFQTGFSCDAVPMMKSLDHLVQSSHLVIDVGANIGITSVWFAKKCYKVYAFEPVVSNRERLFENLELNNINNVFVEKYALSDKEGEEDLYIFPSYGHHSLSPENISKPIDIIKVKVKTIDSFCLESGIDYIDILKIDVEGFEYEVLSGATEMLSKSKVKIIIFEYSKLVLEKQNKSINQVFEILEKYNYKIFTLEHKEVSLEYFYSCSHSDLYAMKI